MRQFVGPVATDSAPSAVAHLTRKDYVDTGDASAVSSAQSSAAGLYLPILGAVSAKTASYTLTDSDATVVFNTASGAMTATLPTAVGRGGRRFVIKKLGGTTANPLTIASNGGTIDGATSEIISVAGGFREVISDGTNWHVIGGKIEPIILSSTATTSNQVVTLDASIGSIYRIASSGAATTITLAPPTNPIDADAINIEVTPSGITTAVSINAAIINCTGVTAPFSVATAKTLFLGLRYRTSAWHLLAYAITP
jgi:hypothetical protein